MNKNILYKIITFFIMIIVLFNNIIVYAEDSIQEDKAEIEFYERVEKVYKELSANGSIVKPSLIGCVYYVSNEYAGMYYYDFDEETIRDLFKYMNSNPKIDDDEVIIYNEESFRENLKKYWLKNDYFKGKNYSDSEKDGFVNRVYDYLDEYKLLMGIEEESTPGNGSCSYNVNGNTVSNIKVRLLYCDGSGPIESEELIDFEEYIIGVVSQENGNGPYEALKAQAVAARSYAMMRGKAMNGAFGVGLKEENGEWVLSLRSCTNDQVFCNPTKGCWSNVKGGQTSDSNKANWKNCTVYSGEDRSKTWSRGPLSEDSEVRKAVEETRGQVAVDAKGQVVYTPYTDTNQQRWNKMAKDGKDYFEILKKDFSSISTISSNCTSSSGNSEAESWKQYDERWGGKYIGTKTIKQVGCMITSASIQIARSGTKINVSDFNPGVFMETIKANGAFSGNNWNNMSDSTWASIAPNFKLGGEITFSGSKSDKINQMKQYISEGKYIIVRLYHPGQHWVAITSVDGDKVMMADPGSEANEFTSKYSISTVTKGYYFTKTD